MPRYRLAPFVALLAAALAATAAPAHAQESRVRCESQDGAYLHCRAATAGEARLVTNLSSTRCEQGRNWDVDGRGVWVDNGCRGVFAVGRGAAPRGAGGVRELTCRSVEYARAHCRAATQGEVRLVRRLSSSECVQGRTWGYDARGVWVDRGCAAEFVVGRGASRVPGEGPGGGRLVRCESLDGRYSLCGVEARGEVRVVEVYSSARCVEGQSWGVEPQRGIWVDRGCRAEFEVMPAPSVNGWTALGVLVGIGVVAAVLAGSGSDEASAGLAPPVASAGHFDAFDHASGDVWQLHLHSGGTATGMLGPRPISGTWTADELEVDGRNFTLEPTSDGFQALPAGAARALRFHRFGGPISTR